VFVNGLDQVLAQAKEAAGPKDLSIMDGAEVIRQALAGGYVEELTLSIAPVILGSGKRLFDGFDQTVGPEQVSAVQLPWVTHLRYRVSPSALIATQRMIVGDLYEDDADTVGVRDPHLDQTPRLLAWRAQHGDAGGAQPLVLHLDGPHLQPDHDRGVGRLRGLPGQLKEPVPEEEDEAWVARRAELAVDRETEHVAIEPAAALAVRRA
jgi:hypothetical protein